MALADDCADVNAVDFSYPFLAGIDPANPPPSIVIPAKYLDAMANMERQYWDIKAKRYNVIIFFKKGKFYELYDHDAVIANKEFGLKMVFDTTNRGKMRLAGVPEQSLSEWSRLFVFRGYKVGRVEQMVKGADENSPGGGGGSTSKAKIVPRELVEVLTPGTLTDAAMLSDHNEVFLLALAPQPQAGVVDAFALDLSRRVVYWCPCGHTEAVRRYRASGATGSSAGGLQERMTNENIRPNGAVSAATPVAVKREGGGGGGVPATWTEAALRSVTALLQQLHPREVVMPETLRHNRGGGLGQEGGLSTDALSKWVQADGYTVEPALTAPASTAAVPTAKQTIATYLRSLKLERELPLLEEAVAYHAHVFSTTSSSGASVETPDEAAGRSNAPPASLLTFERRQAAGLVLDSATVSNLEIVSNLLDGSEKQSLHQCLNRCITNGGKRLFRAWLLRPSASAKVIQGRQDAVRFLLQCGVATSSELWGLGGSAGGGEDGGSASQMTVTCTPDAASLTRGPQDDLSPSPRTSELAFKRPRGSEEVNGAGSSAPSQGSTRSSAGRSSVSGNAHFMSRFAHMLAVDFERCLSRLAEIKSDDQHQTISYVDPLVKYHKSLGIILSAVQAFSEMVDWAVQFHAMCRRRRSQLSTTAATSQAADVPQPPHGGTAASLSSAANGDMPALVEELLLCIESAADSVTAMERLFDRRAAAETGMLTPAPGTSAAYDEAVDKLTRIEAKLHEYKRGAQQDIFGGEPVNFVDVGKDLFLLEVATAAAPKMTPRGMVERARSGKSVKYVVDALAGLVEAHKEATAAKSAALLTVLQSVATKMCEHCPTLYAATTALSYLDCLINLARLTHRFPGTSFPEIVHPSSNEDVGGSGDEPMSFLEAKDLVHPLLTRESGCSGSAAMGVNAVPNDICLDGATGRVLVLTGPNMAGKSTLMRTVAVNVLLAQLGGPVLASQLRLAPISRIFTRIGARDATQKGQSTLFVELNETAEILRSANGGSLCLIDELGRGTSTHDGLAIAHATLQAIKDRRPFPPLTIFSTHYHSLALEQARRGGTTGHNSGSEGKTAPATAATAATEKVQLGYMDFALTGGGETADAATDGPVLKMAKTEATHSPRGAPVPKITFLYRLVPGICDRSYGVEVALMAGVRPALVELARDKSHELATVTALHEDLEMIRSFIRQKGASAEE